jgi:hypothetical protein
LNYSIPINGTFKVYGEDGEFSWLVIATREHIEVEPFKKDMRVDGFGPYKWREDK